MRIKNKVKRKLREGRPTLGSWIMIGELASAEIMADAGFDWITVPLVNSGAEAEAAVKAAQGLRSCSPTIERSSITNL